MTLRLLAVHAHPDDESSKGAGSYAYYRSIGAEVMVVSCTGGERGDVQNEALAERAMAERDMAGLRRIEMARAQRYSASSIAGSVTSTPGSRGGEEVPANSFAVIPLEFSAAPLVKIIRELRPQVLVTYDENGGYPHPDHIRTHELSMYAFAAAAEGSDIRNWGSLADQQGLLRPHVHAGAGSRACMTSSSPRTRNPRSWPGSSNSARGSRIARHRPQPPA